MCTHIYTHTHTHTHTHRNVYHCVWIVTWRHGTLLPELTIIDYKKRDVVCNNDIICNVQYIIMKALYIAAVKINEFFEQLHAIYVKCGRGCSVYIRKIKN